MANASPSGMPLAEHTTSRTRTCVEGSPDELGLKVPCRYEVNAIGKFASLHPLTLVRYLSEFRVNASPSGRPLAEHTASRTRTCVTDGAKAYHPTSHADFGAATHPGVGGGTHRRRATVERC